MDKQDGRMRGTKGRQLGIGNEFATALQCPCKRAVKVLQERVYPETELKVGCGALVKGLFDVKELLCVEMWKASWVASILFQLFQ